MRALILNGPNLRRLDLREKGIYGDFDYGALEKYVTNAGRDLEIETEIRQTDDEAELIGWLHEAADKKLPVIINPAAFTHYSYAIRDAVVMLKAPVIECIFPTRSPERVPPHLSSFRSGKWHDLWIWFELLPVGSNCDEESARRFSELALNRYSAHYGNHE